ncbi:ParB/RepB/Spo0J family partition protein [Blastopirellula sp. JC732]|uniref:ParB/RepB/Spo0J family partition protein n=1 Tax=Blastopirellula sediminis TaxID=2894196 RepID=A0A9X1MGU0_9BACT|nr:ParB/RepB/Spo0J family partition protein [Blastopirellula sediminis]MCC9604273.1 ParB/RepB/Spo0J family partition protein [Blastopirellula sediminis]MCC9626793.1 ParB/RepB/Spo0J family partition protein [Blastopirellula sediminis]
MTKQKRLGRGLAALLGGPMDETGALTDAPIEAGAPRVFNPDHQDEPAAAVAPAAEEFAGERLIKLPVEEIDANPYQPRQEFNDDEIAELAQSLQQHDMLQPIAVRMVEGRYQLISGERRLRAAIVAGWDEVPVRVFEADDQTVAELAIVENLQRKDLNAIEKAMSFERYLHEHGCTQSELAERIGVDRSTVANLLRLLELPEPVMTAVMTGELTAGHARALLPLGEEGIQVEFARRIFEEGWSVRGTEEAVQDYIHSSDGPQTIKAPIKKGRTVSDQVASLEQEFRMALGTKVDIKQSGRGGKIVLHFKGNDEFDRIRDHLLGGATELRKAG